ncbi:hypothetical protein BRYFOR_05044 [Marvinbryantia formatexigens DSM 14469]|uniref:DUF6036 domain-containing protein n=1 Tax=Marvinbryantia formatexigens DSM 14469 TaxID=478749 RepID=C6L8V5_9FIRM|nr:DUF6036 family nucleotidyltransferase [Marvinbryantia formatexigens]EET62694.1 hypothetical protein BRYFOR_05044 [Marvinbryantia formatexigens DSM 14469]UWO23066.1 DUF6036 family nucleotidyltransferase [Marvinbryantia formatexigens DSM 14469]SDF97849.1 hypothetical protein SAMN05660368_01676 [Marvinbryantia formatexigens]
MSEVSFTKDNLDGYLKELSREFRKMNGTRMPAEIILIGGAAVLINYGFREMTYDIDAIIQASSTMKDAINHVGDRMGLPNGWLNTDFMKTTSYTPKLIQYSRYYKTFSNVLRIRTISAEYLVVMKLMAGRQYKNDLSDVAGILLEQKNAGKEISFESVKRAAGELYGGYDNLPETSRTFIEAVYQNANLAELYTKICEEEKQNKNILLEFEDDYPEVLNGDNLAEILKAAKAKKNR